MERLGRGVVAVRQDSGRVFVSWRLLGTDPEHVAFNLYRIVGGAAPVRVNAAPLTTATSSTDRVFVSAPIAYTVRSEERRVGKERRARRARGRPGSTHTPSGA